MFVIKCKMTDTVWTSKPLNRDKVIRLSLRLATFKHNRTVWIESFKGCLR